MDWFDYSRVSNCAFSWICSIRKISNACKLHYLNDFKTFCLMILKDTALDAKVFINNWPFCGWILQRIIWV
jgi:hypothetical protein